MYLYLSGDGSSYPKRRIMLELAGMKASERMN
jgi:hypothetical protein